ncbi:pheromone-regulated protein prm10 [Sorochytrium milnesiophthora]
MPADPSTLPSAHDGSEHEMPLDVDEGHPPRQLNHNGIQPQTVHSALRSLSGPRARVRSLIRTQHHRHDPATKAALSASDPTIHSSPDSSSDDETCINAGGVAESVRKAALPPGNAFEMVDLSSAAALAEPSTLSTTPPPFVYPHRHTPAIDDQLYSLSRAEGYRTPPTTPRLAPTPTSSTQPAGRQPLPPIPPIPTQAMRDYTNVKNFLLKLAKAAYSFGLPAHRLESELLSAASALNVSATFGVLPSSVIASFEHPWGLAETVLVSVTPGMDVGRQHLTGLLCARITDGSTSIEEALVELDEIITKGGLYSPYLTPLAFGIGSFAGAPLAFGGSWADAGVAAVLGVLVGLLNTFMAPTRMGLLFEFSAAAIMSFITLSLKALLIPSLCFSATTFSSLLVPLPGLWISTSFLELASRHMVSGSSRMWWSLMVAFQLAFGTMVGQSAFKTLFGQQPESITSPCAVGLHPAWNALLLPCISFSLNVLLNAHYHQYIPMTMSTIVSYLLFLLFAKHFSLSIEATALITSFVIGVVGNLWSRYGPAHASSSEVVLCGIMLLVPGSVATRAGVSLMAGFAGQPGNVGVALQFIVISMAISIGLLASRIVPAGVDTAMRKRKET